MIFTSHQMQSCLILAVLLLGALVSNVQSEDIQALHTVARQTRSGNKQEPQVGCKMNHQVRQAHNHQECCTVVDVVWIK